MSSTLTNPAVTLATFSVSNAPAVVGKPDEDVEPPTTTRPVDDRATAVALSVSSPPRNELYTAVLPLLSIIVRKPSVPPLCVASSASGVVGRSIPASVVEPTT